jgi:aspartate/methionine/tyrosine aminotransferase
MNCSACKAEKIVVLIDDAYFGLVYEDNVFKNHFHRLAGLHENVLAVNLDGAQEDYVWGLGWLHHLWYKMEVELYEALENKTAARSVQYFNISHTQSLLQAVYSDEGYEPQTKKYTILKNRYSLLKETIIKSPYPEYIEPLPFNSGYFMCLKLRKGLNAEQVRLHLLDKYSTGVIVFGDVIRLAFSAVPLAKIPEMVDNLYHAAWIWMVNRDGNQNKQGIRNKEQHRSSYRHSIST